MNFFKMIKEDIRVVFERDPAARTPFEVFMCYPGLRAVWMHRIAHWFWNNEDRVMARLISHISRHITGIEIHPGANIGRHLFIDHGMGVVIGETTEIGDDCLLYQGVVLGGTSTKKIKRHPTLEDDVTVGAGAIVLGPVRLGKGSRIGAGSVVIHDVPPGATVIGVPGRVVEEHRRLVMDLEHGRLPDPVADAVRVMFEAQESLEKRLAQLEKMEGVTAMIDEYFEKKRKEIEKEFGQTYQTKK